MVKHTGTIFLSASRMNLINGALGLLFTDITDKMVKRRIIIMLLRYVVHVHKLI